MKYIFILLCYLIVCIIIILSITLSNKYENKKIENDLDIKTKNLEFEMSNADRIKYYMGKWVSETKKIKISDFNREKKITIPDRDTIYIFKKGDLSKIITYFDPDTS